MEDERRFEAEVRRIAGLLWPSDEGGATMISEREHDGVFKTEDCIHLVECTVSRRKDKAQGDSKKMANAAGELKTKYPDKVVKGWFITRDEPTADQNAVCRTYSNPTISAQSFHQFHGKLISAADYLRLRGKHRFGSAYDPKSGSPTENLSYVTADLRISGSDKAWSIRELTDSLIAGGRYLFVGDYGVGKSMTLRELFLHLSDRYNQSKSSSFPIYINLREHHGQKEPAEILERHARSLGFSKPSHLVRAWKAGYTTLLIDGFDEVSSVGIQTGWKRLRDTRHASMEGVRLLISNTPLESGIAVAGRESYFDTNAERTQALGTKDFSEIILGEFTEEQIVKLLDRLGYSGYVPAWMPSRPLLLSTLFSKVTGRANSTDTSVFLACEDPAEGWTLLLEELCNREAKPENGLSGETIRDILESLATRARAKGGGLGPLTEDEQRECFMSACGPNPPPEALTVLARLPGLRRDESGIENSRMFVDDNLTDALRAGDLARYVLNPYGFSRIGDLCAAQTRLGEIALGITLKKLRSQDKDRLIKGALAGTSRIENSDGLAADLLLLAWRGGLPSLGSANLGRTTFDKLQLSGDIPDMSNVTFQECYFNRVELDLDAAECKLPHFCQCLILEMDGRTSQQDLPQSRFVDCDIEKFSEATLTTTGISNLPVSPEVKVLLSVLKRLFIQGLSGREENALYRGLSQANQQLVPGVLELLRQQQIIIRSPSAGDDVWLPVKRQLHRVRKILDAPSQFDDPLMIEARKLGQ